MTATGPNLSPTDAARRLGVSVKALRLYEQEGLVVPGRTAAGWRAYSPDDMARAAEVVALRDLGLTLAQAAEVLRGDARALELVLAAHEARLQGRAQELSSLLHRVRAARAELAAGQTPRLSDLAALLTAKTGVSLAFDLPWPWGGERFAVQDLPPTVYIIGPLGSGKTRLARRIAETLAGAVFLDLDRTADAELVGAPAATLRWLIEEGASPSPALTALLAGIEADAPSAVVVDMVEQGLDAETQAALRAWLRRRGPDARPLFLMTRSSAILDLADIGPDAAILLCPANHSPPSRVAPHAGAPGYEAVATCLASPEVRARSEGVIAWRPDAA